jgi:hypothetical protein
VVVDAEAVPDKVNVAADPLTFPETLYVLVAPAGTNTTSTQ